MTAYPRRPETACELVQPQDVLTRLATRVYVFNV